MNFLISKKTFFDSLSHFQSVVEKRNTIPILSNIKLTTDNNFLKISATDLSIQLSEKIEAKINTEGQVTVPSQMLFDIIRKAPEKSEIEVRENNQTGKIFLFFNSTKFSLPYLPAADYPEIDVEESLCEFVIEGAKLKFLVDNCKFSMGTDESRPYLNGVYMHASDNNSEIITVATDGHRLSKCFIKVETHMPNFKGVIIPKKAVNEVSKLLDHNDSAIKIKVSKNKILFDVGKISLISKLVNANFPDYESVIPKNNNLEVVCDTNSFSETIDRVSTISAEKFRTVKLEIEANKCTVSSFGEEKSAGTEKIDVAYDGKIININFNARYLLEVLSIIKSEKIKINFAEGTAPTVLQGVSEKNSVYLIMQMRA